MHPDFGAFNFSTCQQLTRHGLQSLVVILCEHPIRSEMVTPRSDRVRRVAANCCPKVRQIVRSVQDPFLAIPDLRFCCSLLVQLRGLA